MSSVALTAVHTNMLSNIPGAATPVPKMDLCNS